MGRNRACAAVPHAYAWGYVLSPLRGLGWIGEPWDGTERAPRYPTLTRGATCCRRFAAWRVLGEPWNETERAPRYPTLTHGATCCRRFAAYRVPLVPWLRRGTHCLGGSASLPQSPRRWHGNTNALESSWFVVVGLRCMVQFAVAASRLGVDRPAVERNRARAAVPHAHAWGYVLSPLRGLGWMVEPWSGAERAPRYPTLTHGATCCRRFAAWGGWLSRGTEPSVRRSTPRLRVGLRAAATSRLGVDRSAVGRNRACAAVPHAYAWGYVLPPLRGLGWIGEPWNETERAPRYPTLTHGATCCRRFAAWGGRPAEAHREPCRLPGGRVWLFAAVARRLGQQEAQVVSAMCQLQTHGGLSIHRAEQR